MSGTLADWTKGVEAIVYQSCGACGKPQYFHRSFCAGCGAPEPAEKQASDDQQRRRYSKLASHERATEPPDGNAAGCRSTDGSQRIVHRTARPMERRNQSKHQPARQHQPEQQPHHGALERHLSHAREVVHADRAKGLHANTREQCPNEHGANRENAAFSKEVPHDPAA